MGRLLNLALQNPTGTYPDLRDYHERVGRALVQVLALSHRSAVTCLADGSPIESLADLRRIDSAVLDVNDDAAPALVQVGKQAGNIWAWFRYLNTEESATVLRPDDVQPGDPGRLVKQVLPIGADCGSNRYYAHVEYAADQLSTNKLIDRARGKTPALFVSLIGDDPTAQESQTYAYHKISAEYRLRVVSANFHGGVQARFQSPVPEERANDPGTQRMIGDIRQALIYDNRLMRCLGVAKTSILPMRTMEERDAERYIFDQCSVRVIGYTLTPNTPCEIVSPWKMWVQLQDAAGLNAGPPVQVPGYGQATTGFGS
jgi:hypothetical protein